MSPSLLVSVELIKAMEGCRLRAYSDIGGVWTVGYGATGPDVDEDTVWTPERASADLARRVTLLQAQLTLALKKPVTGNQLVAMTSLAYNIGLTAFVLSSVCRHFNRGSPELAADAFLFWDKVHGKKSEGLHNRRTIERALFLTPDTEAPHGDP